MGLFTEEGADIIDFTLLKKRGIINVPERKETPRNYEPVGDVLDFTAIKPGEAAGSSEYNSSSGMPDLGFLGNMAAVGAENNSTNTATATSYYGNSNSGSEAELNALKIKIDDMDYKLNRLLEKLEKIEGKLGRG